MSGQPQLPPPANPALLPLMAAVVYLAAVVALWGVLSLLLDREVVDYPDAGPLLGPAMVVSASLVTWLGCRRSGGWPGALLSFAAVFIALSLIGALGYTLTRGDLGWIPRALVHFAISPFVAGAALLSALVVLGVRGLRSATPS